MPRLEIITVPYNSAGRPNGVAAGPGALRAAGLTDTLHRHADLTDHGDVELTQQPDATRGVSGLVAEVSLTHMVGAVRDRTTAALRAHRFPLLIGGDCPVLLGGLAAIRSHTGSVGVLFRRSRRRLAPGVLHHRRGRRLRARLGARPQCSRPS